MGEVYGMGDLIGEIAKTDAVQIEEVMRAVVKRYGELFPDWEVSMISLDRKADRSKQIDEMIAMLQSMKTFG